MRRARTQLMDALFNGDLWPSEYDDDLMQKLDKYSEDIPTLQSPGIFNALLHFTYTEMRHKFGPSVTLTKMKKRVQRFRTKFMAFQGYINLPGVTFLRSLHTVRIDGDIYFQQFKDGRPVRFFSVINGSKCIHACNISSTYHFPL